MRIIAREISFPVASHVNVNIIPEILLKRKTRRVLFFQCSFIVCPKVPLDSESCYHCFEASCSWKAVLLLIAPDTIGIQTLCKQTVRIDIVPCCCKLLAVLTFHCGRMLRWTCTMLRYGAGHLSKVYASPETLILGGN